MMLRLCRVRKNTHFRSIFTTTAAPLERSYEERRVIHVSQESLFDVVADVASYKTFLPFCVSSNILKRPNENVMEAELAIGFKYFTEKYVSRVLMKRPSTILIKSIASPTFEKINSEWHISPVSSSSNNAQSSSSCNVHFKVNFKVNSFLHAQAMQLFFTDVVKTQLGAFVSEVQRRERKKKKNICTEKTAPSKWEDLLESKIKNQNHLKFIFKRFCQKNKLMDFEGFRRACSALATDDNTSYLYLAKISKSLSLSRVMFVNFTSSAAGLTEREFILGFCILNHCSMEERATVLFAQILSQTSSDSASSSSSKIDRKTFTKELASRLDTIESIVPDIISEQELSDSSSSTENRAEQMKALLSQVREDIPIAVNQLFQIGDLDQSDSISLEEWQLVIQIHPEWLELMTVDGMIRLVRWMSAIGRDDVDINSSSTFGDNSTTSSIITTAD